MHGKIASRCRWGCIGRTFVWRNAALAASLSALAAGAVAGAAAATAVATPPDASANFAFQTADNSSDLTFNQLLGINDSDTIAGYFGSGMAGHPNKGYTLHVNYRNENFPGSAQTQVTGLNNGNTTVGFWVDKAGDDSGFYSIGGRRFHTADYPTANPAKPAVDQLLGVNDSGVAVGFYTDGKGANHGYSYNISTRTYRKINVSGDTNVTAAAINNLGDIAGFATNGAGTTEGFLQAAEWPSRPSRRPRGDDHAGVRRQRRRRGRRRLHGWHRLERDDHRLRLEPRLRVREHQRSERHRRDDDQRRQRPRRARRLLHRLGRQHRRTGRSSAGALARNCPPNTPAPPAPGRAARGGPARPGPAAGRRPAPVAEGAGFEPRMDRRAHTDFETGAGSRNGPRNKGFDLGATRNGTASRAARACNAIA